MQLMLLKDTFEMVKMHPFVKYVNQNFKKIQQNKNTTEQKVLAVSVLKELVWLQA